MKYLAAVIALVASSAVVAEGQFEINQLCVADGCFAGDNPGWPIEINNSGGYRLTSNIDVPADVTAISILENKVQIDLQGHSIEGPVSCTGSNPTCAGGSTGSGIVAIDQQGIAVKDGSISGFGNDCIQILGPTNGLLISDLFISNCGEDGIDSTVTGIIQNVTISDVGVRGAFLDTGTIIQDSVIRNAGSLGISFGICKQNLLIANNSGLVQQESCLVNDGSNICNNSPCL